MANHIRIKSIKRKRLEEDKLALAFLLLAKIVNEADAVDHEEVGDTEAA
jgi:hypothetical protein